MNALHRMPTRLGVLVSVLLIAVVATGCEKKLRSLVIPNQLPEVRITSAPIDTFATCTPDPVRSCYALTVNWVGHDSDGRVDRYLWAVDPPSEAGADTAWEVTENNEIRVVLTANRVDNPRNPGLIFEEPHVFVLKAVDNRGAEGPATFRAFYSFTQAPSVLILNPRPSELLTPLVPPTVRITWSGNDPDGVFSNKPVRYRYTLLSSGTRVTPAMAAANRDTLRSLYAPDFGEWEHASADSTDALFTNLTPGEEYMFVVVAFDEAGAYSPVFTRTSNMLRFRVGFAGVQGPKITFFNEFFNYTYTFGQYCACPEAEIFLEVPAARRLTMNWFAEIDPPTGASIQYYRWMVDGDVADETPRENENTDLSRWSSPSINVTSVRLGPWAGGEEHFLYLEAADNNGLKSLGIVRFQVVSSSLEKDLLIVDDTRFNPDILTSAGCTAAPLSTWPTAAEFDTFMFAVGGYPWQCYPTSPTVTLSTPGVFSGYAFDTLGTRYHRNEMGTRLASLGGYAHVVWITDYDAAGSTNSGTSYAKPITSLRYMSDQSRVNTLGAYVAQGGRVWMIGGGVAYAANIEWDDRGNNNSGSGGSTVFRTSGAQRELAPGRFMYDLPHWQTAIEVKKAIATVNRSLGRYSNRSDAANPWTSYSAEIPATLQHRSVLPRTDPLPPLRNTGSYFTQGSIPVEYLFEECRVIEDVNPDIDILDEQSTLDTLMVVTGSGLPRGPFNSVIPLPTMTYYHGLGAPQGFLMSGFPPWEFKRTQFRALVDFVFRRMWNLPTTSRPGLRATRTIESAPEPVRASLGEPPGRPTRLGRGAGPRTGVKPIAPRR